MNPELNLIVGPGLLALCLFFRTQGKTRLSLALLILAGLALRLYMCSDQFLNTWDERYHALVAKHLAKDMLKPLLYLNPIVGQSTINWTNCHVWLHKQPMALWLMAISIKVFGAKVWVVRLPSIILSTIGIKLMYDIAKALYSQKVAFVSALLFATHGVILELCSGKVATDHIEIAQMFFILLGVRVIVKSKPETSMRDAVIIGACLGCAILSKWLPALILLLLWATYNLDKLKFKNLVFLGLLIISVAALIVVPWQLYILKLFPQEARAEYALNNRHIFEVIERRGGTFWYYFNYLRVNYGELVYLPIAWFSYIAFKNRQRSEHLLLLWFWLPFLFFSLCATKMQAYTIIAAPAIFIITALGYFHFLEIVNFKWRWLPKLAAIALIALPLRFTIERLLPLAKKVRDPKWNKEIKKLAASNLNNSRTVIFNCQHYIETMFATECTCYDFMPEARKIEELKAKGYNVVIQKTNAETSVDVFTHVDL